MELNKLIKKGLCECIEIIKNCEPEIKNYKCFSKIHVDLNFKKDTKLKTGVYIFYSDQEFFYVGISVTDLHSRISQHFQKNHDNGLYNKLLDDGYDPVDFYEGNSKGKIYLKILILNSAEDVNRIELFLISILNPEYNHQIIKK